MPNQASFAAQDSEALCSDGATEESMLDSLRLSDEASVNESARKHEGACVAAHMSSVSQDGMCDERRRTFCSIQ